MKRLLIFITTLLPTFVFAQFQSIQFDCKGMHLDFNEADYSHSIVKLLGLESNYSFIEDKSRSTMTEDEQHFTFVQYYKGTKVEYTTIKIHFKDHELYYINGDYVSGNVVTNASTISEQSAFKYAVDYTNAKEYIWDNPKEMEWLHSNEPSNLIYPKPHCETVFFVSSADSTVRLSYKFDIYAKNPISRNYVYVDCGSGKILGTNTILETVVGTAATRYSGSRSICTTPSGAVYQLIDNSCSRGNGIETYNMQKGSNYSAAVMFTDNDNNWTSAEYHNSNKDDGALDAHWGAEMQYDYFKTKFGRNGIDNVGFKLKGYVHTNLVGLGLGFSNNDNAFWDGSTMTYGDGSSLDVLTSIDIVAHEIGHGFCQKTASLIYSYEPGAINEGLSDIWGACVENFATTGKQTWLLGEDIGGPFRDMSNPKSKGQPDTYLQTNWATGLNDNGGVHTNSGVMNHWFYLLSVGGTGTNDLSNSYSVGGIGIDKAAQIVYRAETNYLTSHSDYAATRKATIQAANDIFGGCSNESLQTINAWYAVGVGNPFSYTQNLVIYSTPVFPIVKNEYAKHIISYSSIPSSSRVKYEANDEIILDNGFNTQYGAQFLAQIVPCRDHIENLRLANPNNTNSETNTPVSNTFEKEGFNISPNPTRGQLRIKANQTIESPYQVDIIDQQGRVIKTGVFNNPLTEIDLSEIANGVYFVKINANHQTYSYKLIKN